MDCARSLIAKHLAGALLVGIWSLAQAGDETMDGPPPGWVGPPPGWSGGVLGGLMQVPDFEGSRTTRDLPVLGVVMTFRSENWGTVEMGSRGVKWTVVREPSFSAGVGQSIDPGRVDNGEKKLTPVGIRPGSERLSGMGSIDATQMVSGFASMALAGMSLDATLKQATSSYEGAQLDVGFTLPWKIGKHLDVSLTPGFTMADRRTMQAYFGVTAEQAARTGHPEFHLGSGLKSTQISLDMDMAFSRHWHATGTLLVKRLQRDAARSPITEKPTQVGGMLAALYQFQI
jgi:outer membrane protein